MTSTTQKHHSTPTIGYLKDATAFPLFFIAIILMLWFKDLNGFRGTIVGILVLAFFVDGTFTFHPRLHCTRVGMNEETIFLITVYLIGILFIFGALIF